MYRYHVSPKTCELFGIAFRFDYHKVHIERFFAVPGNGFDYRHTERYVRDENTVHDVQVDKIGGRSVEHLHVALQIGEISREERRGYKFLFHLCIVC